MTETQHAPPTFAVRSVRHTTPSRISAARWLVFLQAPFLLLEGFASLNGGSVLAPVLMFIGTGVLLWGGFRIGQDLRRPPPAAHATDAGRVPWDWTDVVIFVPAIFAADTILASILLPIGDQLTSGASGSLQTAVRSSLSQICFDGGGLMNLWVLASLRRGATLFDIGWRRFPWWWIPAAIGVAWVTLQAAGYLEVLSQQLMPTAQNTQCIAVRAEYPVNFIWMAAIVVCLIVPFSEELVFRGFIYGWARRAMPVPLAVVVGGAIFGAAHQVSLLFIPLFAVGVALCLVYQGSRSVFPGMLVHALFNVPGLIGYLSAPSC